MGSSTPINFANNIGASYGVKYGDLINRAGTFDSSTTLGNGLASGTNTANLYNGGAQTYGYGTAQVPSSGAGLGLTRGQSHTSGDGAYNQWPYNQNQNQAGNYGTAQLYG